MIGTALVDKSGKPIAPPSLYQPSEEVSIFTSKIKKDYQIGSEIQGRPFREFNDLSLLGVMDRDQKIWNTYIEPASPDPDEAWRYNGKRPLTRNKLISIAAHVTANLLIPNVFAQNEQDEADQAAAHVMRDLLEWNIDNSDYETSFLFGVISALTNPAVYFQSQFVESVINIKERDAQGRISKKEVLDDIFSGLKVGIVPVEEVLISNPYEFEIQKQRFTGRRSFKDYDELEAVYGKHPNWKHVRPGIMVFYDAPNRSFYDQVDDSLITLGEEFTYYNRREDTEVVFINGIYFGEDNIDANPFTHRDSQNRPKYNLAKGGYEPIDEKRFHYFKSAASKLFPDDKLINAMWSLRMDVATIQGIPPIGLSGSAIVSQRVMLPGAVTQFGADAKVTPLTNGMNLSGLDGGIKLAEQSMAESSQDNVQAGIRNPGSQTAYEIAKLQENAKIQLGLFGKMISKTTEDLGYLMMDDILMHETVGELSEMTADDTRMQFPTFLIHDKMVDGQNVSKTIKFTDQPLPTGVAGRQFQYDLLQQEGGLTGNRKLFLVNTDAFRNLRFKLKVSADNLIPKSDAIERAQKMEAYTLMRGDPFFEQQAIRKDFLIDAFPFSRGHADKYLSQNPHPMRIPKEVINFKDMSPEGQAQMAAQAGITLGGGQNQAAQQAPSVQGRVPPVTGALAGSGGLPQLMKP